MKLSKITYTFTAEELEAIHYAMEMGIRHCKNITTSESKWIEIADKIRRTLPIRVRRGE